MSLIPSNIQALAALASAAGQARARDARLQPKKDQPTLRRGDQVDLTVVNVEHESAVRNLKDNLQEDTKEDREANPQDVKNPSDGSLGGSLDLKA